MINNNKGKCFVAGAAVCMIKPEKINAEQCKFTVPTPVIMHYMLQTPSLKKNHVVFEAIRIYIVLN